MIRVSLHPVRDVGICMGDCEVPVNLRTGRISSKAKVFRLQLPRGIELRLCPSCIRPFVHELTEQLKEA